MAASSAVASQMSVKIIIGDCRKILQTMEDSSVHCVVTSPPYWGLRDYGVDGQIGLEENYQDYVKTLVEVFREVKRVLRDDGTLWLNLGDSYISQGGIGQQRHWDGRSKNNEMQTLRRKFRPGSGRADGIVDERAQRNLDLRPKNLVGIPWRVAFALQADGWWLRQDIIWSKPNPMPESITDRCTKAHEYLFLLMKSARYYFDAEAIKENFADERMGNPGSYKWKQAVGNVAGGGKNSLHKGNGRVEWWNLSGVKQGRNKRSVWEVATQSFSEAHFATFPPALIEPCIKAGTSKKGCCAKCGAPWVRMQERLGKNGRSITVPASARVAADDEGPIMGDNAFTSNELERGSFRAKSGLVSKKDCGWSPSCQCSAAVVPCTVLDPFGGAGTTGLVSDLFGRNAILIELNKRYAEMARKRINKRAPIFQTEQVQIKDGTGAIQC